MADIIEWATETDLEGADLEGVTAAYETAQMTYWLGRAKRAILAEVKLPVLAERVRAGLVDEDAAKDVQIDLVLGKFANPGGVRTVQESNGPSSGSITYGGDSPGQLTLTAQHRKMLGVTSGSRRAAGTVDTWR
ncbi:hypothetical protein [Brachybacterium sp. GU-2]|uniref:hypothetical protein n=1 Tax=Brachybacterium sp. GU-2 TaxID=3069708 RepID=UPI00280BFA49|nr:hypothetical protein [Brachybacterium sp. GU-2]WME22146.1 hypothetical protein RBL05_11430 [Brachybacterium sp. GU-2]